MSQPPIAILGAGPSGLTLGRLLDVANISYIIFERDPSPSWSAGRGGTLDIHSKGGQIALEKAGLLDQFTALARYGATNTLAGADGTIYAASGEDDGDSERPEVDRKDLRSLLLESIPKERVQWDCKVERVERGVDGLMAVHFADGEVETGFKLVVAADGMWSKARSLITSAKPQYSGVHHFTTSIRPGNPFFASAAQLAGEGNYFAFGDAKQLTVQKLGEGSYYISIGLQLPENWTSENSTLLDDPLALRHSLLRNWFSKWPRIHTDMIQHCEGDFKVWPLYSMPTDSLSWQSVPGITLIGDAAHVTTPFVGEGVNCAMYDSLQLSEQLAKYGVDNVNLAVQEYEKLMFPRAKDLIQRSKHSGKLLFAPDAPQGWMKEFIGIDAM